MRADAPRWLRVTDLLVGGCFIASMFVAFKYAIEEGLHAPWAYGIVVAGALPSIVFYLFAERYMPDPAA